ncbi:MAG: hypothetical protein U0166_19145 [Acidobacteriota bacterium]
MLFQRTLEAFADTIVPPDAAPGGASAGALALYRDPFYRASLALPAVAIDLNLRALVARARPFASLSLPERTEIVARAEQGRLLGLGYEGLIMLTKLAYYGATSSRAGHEDIGYPGANDGYPPPEPAISFAGDTADGNFP